MAHRPKPPSVRLRPHREAITALQREGFTVTPVRFGSGDHLIVRVTNAAGSSGQITLSGSPRGLATLSILTHARRAVAR